MAAGKLEGLFVIGQNPAVGAPNGRLEREALAQLKWLVVRDLVEIETASFWYDSPEIERGELRTDEIATEVFLLPAAGHAEKDGTFTNTQRLLQWHEKAVEPPGDCRSEAWFAYHLGRRLKERVRGSRRRRDEPLRALTWDYPLESAHGEPVVEAVAREINGHKLNHADEQNTSLRDEAMIATDRKRSRISTSSTVRGSRPDGDAQLDRRRFTDLAADGSTACGCWIYSGLYAGGVNRPRQRAAAGRYGHGWGFAWPSDRRILYNRCSARPDGAPWSERKKLVWWDETAGEWTGDDVPDFAKRKPPGYRPPPGAQGDDAIAGDQPFTMHPDGLGWIWVASGLKDGPLPTHYEPLESPVGNPLYGRQTNPAAEPKERPDNAYAAPRRPALPARADHLPAHRAPHRRRHEPHAAAPRRAAAGALRRDLARAGGRGRDRQRRLGHHRHAARRWSRRGRW